MKTPWRWWRERQANKARDKMKNGFYRAAESFRCVAAATKEVTKQYKSLNQIKMDNLLECNGRRFRCRIEGKEAKGKIRVERGKVYLCQDVASGCKCEDKFGYKYSWVVGNGSKNDLNLNSVTSFRITSLTAEGIEAYKDWQVGDKLRDTTEGLMHGSDLEVIFRSGELVVCKKVRIGAATANFTCDELYNMGYRLMAEPAPEEEIVEVTMDEIAEKLGVPVERLRVKKEE